MRVENPRYENPLHGEFFAAAQAAGLGANADFNDWSHSQEGYGEYQARGGRGGVWRPRRRVAAAAPRPAAPAHARRNPQPGGTRTPPPPPALPPPPR